MTHTKKGGMVLVSYPEATSKIIPIFSLLTA